MNVFTLPDPRPLEIAVAKKLDKNFARNAAWRQFTNGEWFVCVQKNPAKAVVVGRTEVPSDNLFQTLTLVDTLTRNGTKDITLILPYFGYCRHDRIVQKGDHLPADLFTRLFKTCGATRIVTVDLHSALTEKHSPIPLRSLDFIHELSHEILHEIVAKKLRGLFTIVSPDHGSRRRADLLRDRIDKTAPVCWLEKHRDPKTGTVHSHDLMGVKRGTVAVITDDILDTGGTVRECVKKLKANGFDTFYLAITHPIFSANAVHTLRALKFKKIFVSNTVPLAPRAKKLLPITLVDAAPILLHALTSRE